jgi:uncharacterized protein YqjF (DUF2071 family)
VPFLRAEWRDLVLVTYAVSPEVVARHLPAGCEPDLREGHSFVSLVAFDFKNTRVLGIRWPGYTNFPEINLRVYGRHNDHGGVAFIREFVPSRLVSLAARRIYNEPYRRARMASRVTVEGDRRIIEHELVWQGRTHHLRASGTLPAYLPAAGGREHFFKEQDLGFGRTRSGLLQTYRVEHPQWEILRDPQMSLEWDFGQVYGAEWSILDGARPYSVVIAVGSAISVSRLTVTGSSASSASASSSRC